MSRDENRFERLRNTMTKILDRQSAYMDNFFGGGQPYGTIRVTGQKLAEWWGSQSPQEKINFFVGADEKTRAEIRKVTGQGRQPEPQPFENEGY